MRETEQKDLCEMEASLAYMLLLRLYLKKPETKKDTNNEGRQRLHFINVLC